MERAEKKTTSNDNEVEHTVNNEQEIEHNSTSLTLPDPSSHDPTSSRDSSP